MAFEKLQEFQETFSDNPDFVAIIGTVVGSILAFWGERIITIIEAITDIFIVPLRAFLCGITGTGLVGSETCTTNGLIPEIYASLVDVIDAGATSTTGNINFGPLSLPVAFVIVFIVLFMIGWFLRQTTTSNILPGSFTDVPFIGVEEEEEED